jgi:hypothetical protein
MFARTAIAILALATLAAPRSARADEALATPPASPDKTGSEAMPPRFHIDAEPSAALPIGSLAAATGPALGGFIGVGRTLDDRWELVGHAGYLAGTATSLQIAGGSVSSSLSYAPLLGGVRYYLTDPSAIRLYAMAEAGVVLVNGSSTAVGNDVAAADSGSSVYFGGAASIGLQLDVMDLRAGLLTADLGHAGSSTSGLLSLGFRFASF